jgi:hypothetical protein
VRQTRILLDACYHCRRPSDSCSSAAFLVSQFDKFSSQFPPASFSFAFRSYLCCNAPLLSSNIPSSKLYRRRRHCRSDHRRSFSDEELAEILTCEELVRLRVPFTMAARIVPAVSRHCRRSRAARRRMCWSSSRPSIVLTRVRGHCTTTRPPR